MAEPLVETWEINNRINLYMLSSIKPDVLAIPAPKGRDVGEQFAHIHNVRVMWLRAAAPELLGELEKLDGEFTHDAAKIRETLVASGDAISALLTRALAAGGKVRGFKPHATAFLGYMIAHDAYHRGEIGVLLAQIGHPLDKSTSFGMWEWGVR